MARKIWGPSMTPEGVSLYHMIKRCTDPRNKSYKDYGAKGIRVCDDWMFGRDGKSKYETFIADMGLRPAPHYTIDRIESSGNYEPSNCRWLTRADQNKNKSNNVRLTFNGETRILADWARIHGLHECQVRRRLKRGWPVDQALTTPSIVTVRACA